MVPFQIQHSDKVGRYAIANREFNPGDVIFSETPFAFGPKSDSPPVCLGCHASVDCSTRCSSCNWPVCGPQCELIPAHKDAECAMFSDAEVRFQDVHDHKQPCLQYECITPLRTLMATTRFPQRWNEEVKRMEAHNKIREQQPIWKFNQINIVDYLRGPCKLKDVFDEELVHTVCGILESNAFEARSISGRPIRCLYPKLAILSHNCVSNISHSIVCTGLGNADDFRVTVRAAVRIKEHEELFSSYTYSLWPTLIRRQHLKESKYFDCTCARCSDETEMGTCMSSINCDNCISGTHTSMMPLDTDAKWICSNCGDKRTSDVVKRLFFRLQDEIDSINNFSANVRVRMLEDFLSKYEKTLHPQNAYFCIVKSLLIDTRGNLMTDLNLGRQIEFCKSLLRIFDVVEPGHTRIRGTTLYKMGRTIVYLLTIQIESLGKEELVARLKEAVDVLEESKTILGLEPASTIEGKMGISANKLFVKIKESYDQQKQEKLDITNFKNISL